MIQNSYCSEEVSGFLFIWGDPGVQNAEIRQSMIRDGTLSLNLEFSTKISLQFSQNRDYWRIILQQKHEVSRSYNQSFFKLFAQNVRAIIAKWLHSSYYV